MNTSSSTMNITFHGVRGSYAVTGQSAAIYGGETTCQEICVGERLFIVDAGSGIIGLGRELARKNVPVKAAILFSHAHYDHISGFIYFEPVYRNSTRLRIFGQRNIEKILREFTFRHHHPVPLSEMGFSYSFRTIGKGSILRWRPDDVFPEIVGPRAKFTPDDLMVRVNHNLLHPAPRVLNFRFEFRDKSYVFASDVESGEFGDRKLAEFAKGADLLAHDAQFTSDDYFNPAAPRKGWGHSTYHAAIATARLAGVKRLAFVHHNPGYDDKFLAGLEKSLKAEFRNSFIARQGRRISL